MSTPILPSLCGLKEGSLQLCLSLKAPLKYEVKISNTCILYACFYLFLVSKDWKICEQYGIEICAYEGNDYDEGEWRKNSFLKLTN